MAASSSQTSPKRSSVAPETVSARWLLRAFLICVIVAGLCGYGTFCFLFSQGQWQLVLHPARPGAALPSRIGKEVPQQVRFGVDASGQPRVAGIWLQGAQPGPYRGRTVLYMPSGDGSLAASVPRLDDLQQLGLDILAFDYRGYGLNDGAHPSQKMMESDSDAALEYLVRQRGVSPERVILYGEGVGGYLAARLASRDPQIPALIVEAPRFRVDEEVRRDSRTRLLPVRLLFHERFPIGTIMSRLATPKLIIWTGDADQLGEQGIASPKMMLTATSGDEAHIRKAVRRFLDQYPSRETVPKQAP